MKLIRSLFGLSPLLILAGLSLRADPTPPEATPPPPAPTEEVRPPSAAAPDEAIHAPAPDTVSPAVSSEPKPSQSGLRDLTAPAVESPSPAAPIPVEQDDKPRSSRRQEHDWSGGRREVTSFGDAYLPPGESAQAVVAILGNARAEGPVSDAVVAILGNSNARENVGDAVVAVLGNATAEKDVGDSVVAVLGNASANGHVHGQVVSVFGTVTLGANAVIDGEVVCVGGRVIREPGSVVHGQINEVPFLKHFPMLGTLGIWFQEALLKGRLLTLRPHLTWPWVFAFSFLGFYLLLALAFGPTVTRCAETLEQRPLKTILAALLMLVVAPALMVVLLITVIGTAAVFFAVLAALIFGKVAFLAWLGRRLAKPVGVSSPALSVLFGGLLVVVLYTLPLIGLLVWMTGSMLGLGMAVYTAILSIRRDRASRVLPSAGGGSTPPLVPPSPPPPSGVVPPPPPVPTSSAFTAGPVVAGVTASGSEAVPPPTGVPLGAVAATGPVKAVPPLYAVPAPSFASLPRAGFWIRVAASALDVVLVGILIGMLHLNGLFLLLLTVYSVVMWAKKGTTVGGIICGLRVVRIDDRPIDWSVAVVRALGAFLSFAVAGLGFIWVAFDDDRQSWHDKIAGTTVVLVPKGVPLV